MSANSCNFDTIPFHKESGQFVSLSGVFCPFFEWDEFMSNIYSNGAKTKGFGRKKAEFRHF